MSRFFFIFLFFLASFFFFPFLFVECNAGFSLKDRTTGTRVRKFAETAKQERKCGSIFASKANARVGLPRPAFSTPYKWVFFIFARALSCTGEKKFVFFRKYRLEVASKENDWAVPQKGFSSSKFYIKKTYALQHFKARFIQPDATRIRLIRHLISRLSYFGSQGKWEKALNLISLLQFRFHLFDSLANKDIQKSKTHIRFAILKISLFFLPCAICFKFFFFLSSSFPLFLTLNECFRRVRKRGRKFFLVSVRD